MDEVQNPWIRLRSRRVYSNNWIELREDDVTRPDGQPGIYGVVQFKSWAVGVVPLTSDGQTVLVGQYRYPLDLYSWEIPEGGAPKGESPLDGAQRELREETGLDARTWTYLGEAHLSNSTTDETGCTFLAEDLTSGVAEPEGTEKLQLRWLPFEQACDMALSGEISDALSIIALLRARHYLESGRRWQPRCRTWPGVDAAAQ